MAPLVLVALMCEASLIRCQFKVKARAPSRFNLIRLFALEIVPVLVALPWNDMEGMLEEGAKLIWFISLFCGVGGVGGSFNHSLGNSL